MSTGSKIHKLLDQIKRSKESGKESKKKSMINTIEKNRKREKAMSESCFHMADVSRKIPSSRTARACGTISMGKKAFSLLKARKLPKGDALALCEMAGIIAAKKTSDSIPFCHPIALDYVQITWELHDPSCSVSVFCEVKTFSKTGVEMEALQGVSAALLALYDLIKPVDPALMISGIYLIEKTGGKKGHWIHPKAKGFLQKHKKEMLQKKKKMPFLIGKKITCLIVSDRVFRKQKEDRCAAVFERWVQREKLVLKDIDVVPDEREAIKSWILKKTKPHENAMVFVSGGTGIGTRDQTPQVLEELFSFVIPGIGERLRWLGQYSTPYAALSRCLGGVIQRSLVVALPGNPQAVWEGLNALTPILGHALEVLFETQKQKAH